MHKYRIITKPVKNPEKRAKRNLKRGPKAPVSLGLQITFRSGDS